MNLPEKYKKAFTLVFEGDIRQFTMNPLTTETPWGIPYAVSMGDALDEADELREQLERRPQVSEATND
jgi:hypothetical protein